MADIQSAAAEIRRGKKKKERRRKPPQGKNIMACPVTYRAAIITASICIIFMCFSAAQMERSN